MDTLAPKFCSFSQKFSYTDPISEITSLADESVRNERPIVLFRKQDGKAWVTVQREPSGQVKGFIQEHAQERRFLGIKGLPALNSLDLKHVNNAKKLFEKNIQISDHCIEVIPSLKGGMRPSVNPSNKKEKNNSDNIEEKVLGQIIREKREALVNIQSAIELQENYVGTPDTLESLKWYKKILRNAIRGLQNSSEIRGENLNEWFEDKIVTTFQKLLSNHQYLNNSHQLTRCVKRAFSCLNSRYSVQEKVDILNGIVWEISKIFKALTKELSQIKKELREFENQVILYKSYLVPMPADTRSILKYHQKVLENSIRMFGLSAKASHTNLIDKSRILIEEAINKLLQNQDLDFGNNIKFRDCAKRIFECLQSQNSMQEKTSLLDKINTELFQIFYNQLKVLPVTYEIAQSKD